MPGAILPVALTLSDPGLQQKANSLIAFVEKLICRTHSPCGPKFAQAIQRSGGGYPGYRRGTSSKWNYYLNNGIHLSWDLTKVYNAQNWYFGSGFWEKLRNTGLDNCCLKSKWPPSEAFPLFQKPIIDHTIVKLPNGLEIEVDPERFDATSYQSELDTYFREKGDIKTTPIQTPTVTPNVASTQNMLPLLLLGWFATKGGG